MVSEEDGVIVNPSRIFIKINGSKYHAGPAASIGIEPRGLDPNYIESDEHEALIRASLHLMMRSNHQVIEKIDMMVLGLPVSSFTFQKKKLLEIALLTREVPVPLTLQRNGASSTVIVKSEKTIILPQAYGGLRYAAQEISKDDGPFFDNSLSMVIDPGYKTFDWFISSGMLPEMKLSGSFDGGVSSILRQVSQKIGFDHGTGSLEFDQIEDGLNTGAINLGYKVIDTNPYKSLVLDASRKEIVSFLARIDSNKTRLSRVFLTGGGASFYM